MKQLFTPYIYVALLTLFFNHCYGQKYVLNISSVDSTSNIFLQNIHFKQIHHNKKSLLKSLDSVKIKIEAMGFLNYNLDSIEESSSTSVQKMGDTTFLKDNIYKAYFNLGNQIKLIRAYYDKRVIDLKQTHDIRISSKYFEVFPENLTNTLEHISNTLEKKGNSFSQVALKNISIKNDTVIEADLFIKKSTFRSIDKIIINGYSSFPKTFIKHHLNLKNNTLFNKEKLDKASNIINSTPFVSEIKAPQVLFTKDSTIVYLSLKKENANKFDGLIGFTSKESGKGLSFNGYLDLSLNNLFNSGEHINLAWRNNGNNRQIFTIDVSFPFIFNSKLSPKGKLYIYKQDSSFVNTTFNITLPYKINHKNSIGVTLQTESSISLLPKPKSIIEDYKNFFYGLNYNYQIPNNHTLFKSKFNFYAETLFGKRTSVNKNKQSKFFVKSNFLWSLNQKSHIFLQNQSARFNSETYLNNEMLRIGGMNTLRGFDEESILVSTYSTLSMEYRYVTNSKSYLYSITDVAYIENNSIKLSNKLYAFGLGYAFTSKIGFVNLSYAIGKSSDSTFDINNSRFHLKIISFF